MYSLTKFVPAEHAKVKGLDKRIFAEHRKLKGMTELNAKYRYIQLCRSLKTYGMTFFLVKEKVNIDLEYLFVLFSTTAYTYPY